MLHLGKKTFRHGIHPPEFKDDTAQLPIRHFPFSPLMLIPLQQHIGRAANSVVHENQEVRRGQLLGKPNGFMSTAIHSPAEGIIKRIGLMPSVQGKMIEGIYLQTYSGSNQEIICSEPCPLDSSPDEILNAIQQAGIVGLGGAAFPTHAKLKAPEGKTIDTLIINGAECEPYLTTDHRVMLEQVQDIFLGIRYLLKVTGAQQAIIGIEENKQNAADNLQQHLPHDLPTKIETVSTKYPQGAEKMLIQVLLGRIVPSGGHSVDVHVAGVNVATCAEIGRLLPLGQGIQERVITIGGPGIIKKGNYRIPIGTPLRFLLETVGVTEDITTVFLGGPMMGQAINNLDIPITKGVSGVIAFTQQQYAKRPEKIYPCIHCGRCVDACPMSLIPSQLGLLANNEQFTTMAEQFHLKECFECGACSFVCPSHIPLVQYFRLAKQSIKKQSALKKSTEKRLLENPSIESCHIK